MKKVFKVYQIEQTKLVTGLSETGYAYETRGHILRELATTESLEAAEEFIEKSTLPYEFTILPVYEKSL